MKKIFYKFLSISDDLFLVSSLFLVYVQHILIVFKASSIASLLYEILFIFVALWFFVSIIKIFVNKSEANNKDIISKKKHILLFTCLLITVFSIISVIIDQLTITHQITLEFDYYKKLFIFIEVIFFLFLCYVGNFSKTSVRVIKCFSAIFAMLIILSFVSGVSKTWYGFKEWHGLTLNFHNPNACGLILCVECSVLFYSFSSSRLPPTRLLFLALFAFISFLLFLTDCRSAIISLAVFFGSLIICKLVGKNSLPLSLLIILIPLIFASVYLLYFFASNNGSYYLGSNEGYAGKSDTTRYSIWLSALHNINFNPFIGSYYASSGGIGQFQWHNTEIDILVGFGFFVLLVVILFLLFLSMTLFSSFRNKKATIAFAMFCLIMSLGTFEGFPFYSANGLALLPLLFIPISKEAYRPISLKQKNLFFNKTDILIVGDNDVEINERYHAHLISLNIDALFLLKDEYYSLADCYLSKVFRKKIYFFSSIKIAKMIYETKPTIVELIFSENSSFSIKLISICLLFYRPTLLIYADNKTIKSIETSRFAFYHKKIVLRPIDIENQESFIAKHVTVLRTIKYDLFTKPCFYCVDI